MFGSLGEAGRLRDAQGGFFEASMLPDSEKERLCRSLLAEFGVSSVTATDKGELIHSCCLPYGVHSNGDRNPSASLNYKSLIYNCYACGGGGLLWFIGECRGTGSADARRWLETETGEGPDEQPLSSLLDFFDAVYAKAPPEAKPIPHYDDRVLEPWLAIHPYMTENRHVPVETLMRFKVGYGELRMNLGTEAEPRWISSHRIVIPHFWKGGLVGWQSRRLVEDGTPRWKSTAEFPKDVTLYNYAQPPDRVIVVESPMSVLRHADRHPVVATFGAEVTDRQIKYLSQFERVVLWFDNDTAGWKATEKVGEALEAYCPVSVVPSPYAADPADFDPETFDALLADREPFSVWSRPDALDPWEP